MSRKVNSYYIIGNFGILCAAHIPDGFASRRRGASLHIAAYIEVGAISARLCAERSTFVAGRPVPKINLSVDHVRPDRRHGAHARNGVAVVCPDDATVSHAAPPPRVSDTGMRPPQNPIENDRSYMPHRAGASRFQPACHQQDRPAQACRAF